MADIKLKITTTRDYSCRMSRLELIEVLNGGSGRFPLSHRLPNDTEITITLPSGGDYSGDSLDIDDAGGLQLCWRETETK